MTTNTVSATKRCDLWCWVAAPPDAAVEQSTLFLGGPSALGMVIGIGTLLASRRRNARRRRVAQTPRWQHVASGTAWVDGGSLCILTPAGLIRLDGSRMSASDRPREAWLRFNLHGSPETWALRLR